MVAVAVVVAMEVGCIIIIVIVVVVVVVAVAADTYSWDIVSSCLNEYIAVATFFFVNAHVLC